VLPEPAEGEVVVRALYSGISRGTESLVFNGRVPPSEWRRMRAPFQAGDFPAPVKYGYVSVGQVEQGPPSLQDRVVFVLYPHQTRYVVPADAVHVVPDKVPPERAVMAANLETAINAVWDAQPQIGDRVTVIGGGAVGCLVTWLIGRIVGCRVQLVDTNPRRAYVARAFGALFAAPADADHEADVVIHASGSRDGLELALQVAGFESTILELSWYGDQAVSLPLGGAFHAKRLRIVSSQVGTIALAQRARWNSSRRMRLALELLADASLDALITGESPFDSLPDEMPRLTAASGVRRDDLPSRSILSIERSGCIPCWFATT
jgi:2-desacetyl-2-hydroxyethyl bacteriochlorophyllide A dehydrogenase